MATVLSLALALFFTITTANGLTCYDCNTKDNPECANRYTNFTYPTTECYHPLIEYRCAKVVAKDNIVQQEYVFRRCAPYASGDFCNLFQRIMDDLIGKNKVLKIHIVKCELCNKNKCNSD